MKIYLLFLLPLFFALPHAFATEEFIRCGDTTCRIYRVNRANSQIALVSTISQRKMFLRYSDAEEWAKRNGRRILFATNSGIFGRDFSPLGLHIEEGRQLKAINRDQGRGNFYLKPNGVFLIDANGPSIWATEEVRLSETVQLAVQSGPLLVLKGSIVDVFKPESPNKLVRSGVGVTPEGGIIFAISEGPVSFHKFATLFRDQLGCTDALYLDGIISRTFTPERRDNGPFPYAAFLLVTD